MTVSGQITLDPTTSATATEIGISLPIPSAFVSVGDCAGTASSTAVRESGGIVADVANARATFKWIPTDVTNQPYSFNFSYYIY